MAVEDRETLLARRFRIEINTAWPATGETEADWVQLIGVTSFTPTISEPNMEDDAAYEDAGWASQEKTSQSWRIEATVSRRLNAGAIPEAHQYLMDAATKFGSDSRVHIRWYDRNGLPEAYEGLGTVQWVRANSGATDLDAATLTVHPRGPLEPITNPNNGGT